MSQKNLNKLRKKIDGIDSHIIGLLNERADVSCAIGASKKKRGQEIYSPDRESQVYESVSKKNKGPLPSASVRAIYREIMSACLSLEHPMKIAFLGPELTFTHQAAMKKFGSSVSYISCDTIPDVFREVEKGNADYGVVPIENSTEGAVNHTLDMFVDSPLLICSEIYFPIKECLLSRTGNFKNVKVLYSHPNVFGQCRGWIEKNLPMAKLREVASTTKAAELASKNPGSACIASEVAAKKYELKVAARGIEDLATNVTRFLVVGKHASRPSSKDKTSVVFSVKDKPGILHDMLASFKRRGINLTKIESRPSKKGLWKYYFFVDMDGHEVSPKIARTLGDLEKKCQFFKVLGSYPGERK
ncbi:MAG: prephenate dehydratase [Candidatus Omnitrophica bacterium]|nr:prephenate dehydratase [Candidatus Omnitrophota bacterium]MDD5487574.1 prephenate dehydratase [Candidatus Omnitrophota bacterium]